MMFGAVTSDGNIIRSFIFLYNLRLEQVAGGGSAALDREGSC